MLLANKLSSTQAETIRVANLAVVIISLCLFALVALVIVVPSALRALKTQQDIFDTLIDVPLDMVIGLRDRVAKKMEEVRKAEEAAALGYDVDDDDGAPPEFEDVGPIGQDIGSVAKRAVTLSGPADGLQNIINAYASKKAHSAALTNSDDVEVANGMC